MSSIQIIQSGPPLARKYRCFCLDCLAQSKDQDDEATAVHLGKRHVCKHPSSDMTLKPKTRELRRFRLPS